MTVIELAARRRRLAVVLDPAAVEAVFRSRLPPGVRITEGGGPPERTWTVRDKTPFAVEVDGASIGSSTDPVVATELLLSDLELWLAEYARDRIFVHAGCVVVDVDAMLLPGRTLAGKSTLTAALIRQGAVYYSDEYAVLSPAGRVYPYARPLAIRPRADEPPGPSRRVAAAELGGRTARISAEVALVAILRYANDGGLRVSAVSQGQTVLGLLDNTVAARTRPRAALTALVHAVEGARGLTGARGDADEAAAYLLELLSRG